MKKIITIFTLLMVLPFSMYKSNAQDIERYSKIAVGHEVDYTIPNNVSLSVNGQVFIQDSETKRVIKNEFADQFLLYVEKGVASADLGIGGIEIWGETFPDYVFEPEYKLPTLDEKQAYIKEHKHLPGIIGINELKDQGYFSVNEMLLGQLKNLEELVLNTIEQEKEINKQIEENEVLKTLLTDLEQRLSRLENK